MSNAVMPLNDYIRVCDKIREKTNSTDTIKSGELADKVTEVYEAGKASGGGDSYYDAFWDSFQENGNRTTYSQAFGGFNDETFAPKYDIVIGPQNSGRSMFGYSKITDLKGALEKYGVVLDLSQTTETHSLLYGMPENTRTPKIDFGHLGVNHYQIFAASPKLVEIEEYVVNENARFSQVFNGCTSLTTIKMSGIISNSIDFSPCSLLSENSINSVFGCLSNTASGMTLTLNKTAVNNAFETSSGLADGSTSQEWLNLVATKTNWTISLV